MDILEAMLTARRITAPSRGTLFFQDRGSAGAFARKLCFKFPPLVYGTTVVVSGPTESGLAKLDYDIGEENDDE